MNKFKIALMATVAIGLFACTPSPQSNSTKQQAQVGYLKQNISQAELNNPKDFKRY
ncbi:TPA: hypothetical protein PW692_002358, partial [Mannheimia haemolytica]|nr:hypothetical protein [Mannheimia haemolytica]